MKRGRSTEAVRCFHSLRQQRATIEQRLGYRFADPRLLQLAFVHASFVNEHRHLVSAHNERLEFLGDAVLSLIIAAFLYAQLPRQAEGILSTRKSQLVAATACSRYMDKLGLESFFLLGKGERLLPEGKGKEKIRADLFEALLGAIFVDGGFAAASAFFWAHFRREVESLLVAPLQDWKTQLQHFLQAEHRLLPHYALIDAGSDGKVFHVQALLGNQAIGHGRSRAKREAEQLAAKDALQRLQQGVGALPRGAKLGSSRPC